ncbi:hypothetical protein SGFS_073780 [Streptomyces graminofaciens]|jgi:hypothetical protein|uniref:DUF4328 domain-containing protein n=1 Tax=Streptomyces graminofaciens TaxID=68212 RepID=A0ABM7FI86_9ACTN|nr:hypothetical protein SGFS_073780 [Streptomyces graminofaciens]
MLCKRCDEYAAPLGSELCRRCEAADLHPAPGLPGSAGLPVRTPHGDAWLRSPVGLGRAVAVLLGAVIAADLFAVWADFTLLDALGPSPYGVYEAAFHEAERADWLNGIAGSAQMASYVATAVVFLIWFHRVRVNAEVFEPFGHQKKRGWAIGGWFVPFANLWFPRRIAIDTWDASSPWEKPRSHALVNAWWTLWLINQISSQVATRGYRGAETPEEIVAATERMLFSDAFDIVSAVFAILFVLVLTRMQDAKAKSGPRAPEGEAVSAV